MRTSKVNKIRYNRGITNNNSSSIAGISRPSLFQANTLGHHQVVVITTTKTR